MLREQALELRDQDHLLRRVGADAEDHFVLGQPEDFAERDLGEHLLGDELARQIRQVRPISGCEFVVGFYVLD